MKTFISLILFSLLLNSSYSEPIPSESLYLGQTPPGNSPKTFNLSVGPGLFASDRIAISKDGKELFYNELNGWSPTSTMRIKHYIFTDKWTGPFLLFDGFFAPALSASGDTIYMQKFGSDSKLQAYYSTKNNSVWSAPTRMLLQLTTSSYLQVADNGNFYNSSRPTIAIGGREVCKLVFNGNDTSALSLGLPLNTVSDDFDFSVSRNDAFMIFSRSGLYISYHKPNGDWTNPKSLNARANLTNTWGPYITNDNNFVFYTSGSGISWFRMDNMVDSLRHTNFIPYLKAALPNQIDSVGHLFSYTIPDSSFFDDNENNTLTYSATLSNGSPLPAWLPFNSETGSFAGTLDSIGAITIKVTATDIEMASISTTFTLKIVGNPTDLIQQTFEQNIQVYPNPTTDRINIRFGSLQYKTAILEITDIFGKRISRNTYYDLSTAIIDMTGNPKGIYILNLEMDGKVINKKICLE
jgi:hypothetical protein